MLTHLRSCMCTLPLHVLVVCFSCLLLSTHHPTLPVLRSVHSMFPITIFCCLSQIEFHDMRAQLLGALISEDDEESAARAEEALECVQKLLVKDYDLYAGRHGVPPIRKMDPKMVC